MISYSVHSDAKPIERRPSEPSMCTYYFSYFLFQCFYQLFWIHSTKVVDRLFFSLFMILSSSHGSHLSCVLSVFLLRGQLVMFLYISWGVCMEIEQTHFLVKFSFKGCLVQKRINFGYSSVVGKEMTLCFRLNTSSTWLRHGWCKTSCILVR